MNALLIVHDADERALLSLVVHRAGLAALVDRDVEHALKVWPERPAEMVVLALPTEAETPIAAVKRMRGVTRAPIVVVAEPVDEDDHVRLLAGGADMVVTRPYSSRLLVARLRSLLHRAGGVPVFGMPTLSLSGLSLDPSARLVRVKGREAKRLTQLEFKLLYTLMVHHGQVVPVDELVEQVWGYTGEGNRDLVRGLVNRLRGKIEDTPSQPSHVITVPGVGYRFGPPEIGPNP